MPRLNDVNKNGEGEVREKYILPSLFVLLEPLDICFHVLSRFLDIPSSPEKLKHFASYRPPCSKKMLL